MILHRIFVAVVVRINSRATWKGSRRSSNNYSLPLGSTIYALDLCCSIWQLGHVALKHLKCGCFELRCVVNDTSIQIRLQRLSIRKGCKKSIKNFMNNVLYGLHVDYMIILGTILFLEFNTLELIIIINFTFSFDFLNMATRNLKLRMWLEFYCYWKPPFWTQDLS